MNLVRNCHNFVLLVISYYFDLHCSCEIGAEMTLILWQKSCQPKISNFWLHVVIKKNIAGFYISVNDTYMELLM